MGRTAGSEVCCQETVRKQCCTSSPHRHRTLLERILHGFGGGANKAGREHIATTRCGATVLVPRCLQNTSAGQLCFTLGSSKKPPARPRTRAGPGTPKTL